MKIFAGVWYRPSYSSYDGFDVTESDIEMTVETSLDDLRRWFITRTTNQFNLETRNNYPYADPEFTVYLPPIESDESVYDYEVRCSVVADKILRECQQHKNLLKANLAAEAEEKRLAEKYAKDAKEAQAAAKKEEKRLKLYLELKAEYEGKDVAEDDPPFDI